LLGKVLKKHVPTADQLDGPTQYIVDGTLLPCWSWASHPELYSGKHKTTGMNVQVACTLDGNLAWISDAVSGTGMTRTASANPGLSRHSSPGAGWATWDTSEKI
jgi:hypothetical protein